MLEDVYVRRTQACECGRLQPGIHTGEQKRRVLQEDMVAQASAESPTTLEDAEPAEAPLPHVALAPEVAAVEQLASHDLQRAGALGKSFIQRVGQGVQSINQQMRFPNPRNGPTPEYILSKIEDKLQVTSWSLYLVLFVHVCFVQSPPFTFWSNV